jgi:hypothetical protein
LVATNHLDLAVSRTSDPTGQWAIYRVPVQNDGTRHPDHGGGVGRAWATTPDRRRRLRLYLATNEYRFFPRPGSTPPGRWFDKFAWPATPPPGT